MRSINDECIKLTFENKILEDSILNFTNERTLENTLEKLKVKGLCSETLGGHVSDYNEFSQSKKISSRFGHFMNSEVDIFHSEIRTFLKCAQRGDNKLGEVEKLVLGDLKKKGTVKFGEGEQANAGIPELTDVGITFDNVPSLRDIHGVKPEVGKSSLGKTGSINKKQVQISPDGKKKVVGNSKLKSSGKGT